MPDKLCSIIRVYVMFIVTNQLPFYPVNYVPHPGRRTWIYLAAHFESVEGAQGFIVGFIFVFGHDERHLGLLQPTQAPVTPQRLQRSRLPRRSSNFSSSGSKPEIYNCFLRAGSLSGFVR